MFLLKSEVDIKQYFDKKQQTPIILLAFRQFNLKMDTCSLEMRFALWYKWSNFNFM